MRKIKWNWLIIGTIFIIGTASYLFFADIVNISDEHEIAVSPHPSIVIAEKNDSSDSPIKEGETVIKYEDVKKEVEESVCLDCTKKLYPIGENTALQNTEQVKEIVIAKVQNGPIKAENVNLSVNKNSDKTDFGTHLGIFPQPDINKNTNKMDAQSLFDWCIQVEEIYQRGLFLDAVSITKEQKGNITNWLNKIYTDSLTTKRLDKAFNQVDGGFRINSTIDVFDYSPSAIEKINNLELTEESNEFYILKAELTVKTNTPVTLLYRLKKVDQKWMIDEYSFYLGKK